MDPVNECACRRSLNPTDPQEYLEGNITRDGYRCEEQSHRKAADLPMLDIVRRRPELIPYERGGELAITALMFAGWNVLAPDPFSTDPTTIKYSDESS